MRPQAGGPAHYIFLGWARPIYINRHPQPPAKYIGFSEICQSLYTRIKIYPCAASGVDTSRALGYSGILPSFDDFPVQ